MKKILILLLFIPFVFGLENMHGGETQTLLTIRDCIGSTIDVTVSATKTINNDEYNFTGCDKISNTIWECPCTQPFNLILNVKQNTVNSYNVYVEYDTESTSTSSSGSSSGGGSSGVTVTTTKINNTTVINENKNLEENTNRAKEEIIAGANLEAPTKPAVEPKPPAEVKQAATLPTVPKGTFGTILMIVAIILMILGGAGIGIYKLFFDVSGDDDFDEKDVEDLIYDMDEEDGNLFDKALLTSEAIKEKPKETNMSDAELDNIVKDLKKDDKPKKIKKVKPETKEVDDILKHLDD